MTLVFAPLVSAILIAACSGSTDYPPTNGTPYQAGGPGPGTSGGGGEGGGNSACVTQGGQCLLAGNLGDGASISCPVQLTGVSCGVGSVDEAGMAVLICCSGFNDAGAPDVTPADAPLQ